MDTLELLLAELGDEIQDPDEETFDLFSQPLPSQDLGMVDAKAKTLDVNVAGRDFQVTQSPGVLQSTREGGTTGAAVWQASVRLAEWLAWQENPLRKYGLFQVSLTTVLELGAGIAGIIPCILGQVVGRVVATDQPYALNLLRQNIAANITQRAHGKTTKGKNRTTAESNIETWSLDWETDDVQSTLSAHGLGNGVDLVVVCDCIYNYALINPLVQTCAEICMIRGRSGSVPTVCLIAQQLRQPEVFQQWLEVWALQFRTWRVPSGLLTADLREGSGFVLHMGVLKQGREPL